MRQHLLVVAGLALMQSACTLVPPGPAPHRPAPAPKVKRLPAPAAKSFPLPELPAPQTHAPTPPPPPPTSEPEPTPPAIVALTRQAEVERRQGHLDQAVARLERALRIQPQNAELWHTLARLRLEQRQPKLAEDLAKKSISLARGGRELLRRNWLLIAEARRQSGDVQGAMAAEREAAHY